MNMKKIKKSVKKSTKNNYRIEALEPRLMMDADVVLDLEFQLAANNGFPFEFNNTTDTIKVGLDQPGRQWQHKSLITGV